MAKLRIRKNDKRLKAFVQEVIETLLNGERHQYLDLVRFPRALEKRPKIELRVR